jgi:diguanylate cyclase (GGDEF)-like protein/PAS domain S-box-containing protein
MPAQEAVAVMAASSPVHSPAPRRGGETVVADQSAAMICEYDQNLTMTSLSDETLDLTGMTPQALADLGCEARVHPDDIEALRRGLRQAIDDGCEHFSVVYRLAHGDGSWGWVESIFSIRRDASGAMLGLQSATRDIGSRLLVKEPRDVAHPRGAVDETSTAMGITDLDGVWVRVNPALCELLGYPAEELIGRSAREMTHPDDLRETMRHLADLLADRADAVTTKKRYLRPDGSVAFVSRTATLLRDSAGRPAHFVLQLTDLSKQRAECDAMAARAVADERTGLVNTVLFTERVGLALKAARRRGTRAGVVLVDIDEFGPVNEVLGREGGDQVLREVAGRLTALAGPQDTVTRLAADEFALLCEDVSEMADLEAMGLRVASVFGAPFRVDGRPTNLTASVGLAIDDGGDADHLIRKAGHALTVAKRNGGNRVQTVLGALDLDVGGGGIRVVDLRNALGHGQLELYYQPVIALSDAATIGHEALLRWRHPTRGLLSPDSFLPLLEETVLLHEVGAWVLSRACADAAARRDKLEIAVNVSPNQLAHPDYVDLVANALAVTGLDPRRLVLEITETSILNASTMALNCSAALTGLGITLALDDFGTGKSSLSSLQRMPIGVLKIDRSFTSQIGTSRSTERLITGMIRLAESTELKTTAEGVETPEQAAFLQQQGCLYAQGYLYGRPSPRAERLPEIDDPVGRYRRWTTRPRPAVSTSKERVTK